jgi:hypothetical protein
MLESQAAETLLSRMREIEYMAHACAVAGQEMPQEITQEFLAIERELRRRDDCNES